VVYPNSGEDWDAEKKCWRGAADFADRAGEWYAAGANIIGGCCRTTPEDILRVAAFRDRIKKNAKEDAKWNTTK